MKHLRFEDLPEADDRLAPAAAGGAMLAGVGTGVFANIQSAIEKLVQYSAPIFPQTDQVLIYNRLYQQHLQQQEKERFNNKVQQTLSMNDNSMASSYQETVYGSRQPIHQITVANSVNDTQQQLTNFCKCCCSYTHFGSNIQKFTLTYSRI